MTNDCNRNVKSQTTLTKRYFKIIVSIILMAVLILSIHLFFPWGYFLAKHHKGVPSISTSFLSGLVELSKVLARSSYRPPPLRILSGRGYLMVNSVLREVGCVCTAKLGDLSVKKRSCQLDLMTMNPGFAISLPGSWRCKALSCISTISSNHNRQITWQVPPTTSHPIGNWESPAICQANCNHVMKRDLTPSELG